MTLVFLSTDYPPGYQIAEDNPNGSKNLLGSATSTYRTRELQLRHKENVNTNCILL